MFEEKTKKILKSVIIPCCVFSLCACTSMPKKTKEKSIVWWLDTAAVQEWNWVKKPTAIKDGAVLDNTYTEEFNRLLKKKGFAYPIEFRFMNTEAIPSSDENTNPGHAYLEKIKDKQPVDIFTNMYGNYEDMAVLDSYMKQNKTASSFYQSMPGSYWKTQSVNHHIRYIPNIAWYGYRQAYIVDKKLAEKYHVQKTDLENRQRLTEVLKQIYKGEQKQVIPFAYTDIEATDFYSPQYLPLEISSTNNLRLSKQNGTWKVVDLYDTPIFMDTMLWVEQLNKAKLTGANLSQNAFQEKLEKGGFLTIDRYYPPAFKQSKYEGKIPIPFGPMQSVRVGGNAVYQASKHKEAAVKLLSLINTDKELSEFFIYGQKGKDYDIQDGFAKPLTAVMHLPTAISTHAPCGNYLLITPTKDMGSKASKAIRTYMEQIPVTKVDGFVPQITKEERTLLRMYSDYQAAIPFFIDKDMKKTVENVRSYLHAKGSVKLEKLIQKQLDAFLQGKEAVK